MDKKKHKHKHRFEHKPPEHKDEDKQTLLAPAETTRWGWAGSKTKVDTSRHSSDIGSRRNSRKSSFVPSPFSGSITYTSVPGEGETPRHGGSVSMSNFPSKQDERKSSDDKAPAVSKSDTDLISGQKLKNDATKGNETPRNDSTETKSQIKPDETLAIATKTSDVDSQPTAVIATATTQRPQINKRPIPPKSTDIHTPVTKSSPVEDKKPIASASTPHDSHSQHTRSQAPSSAAKDSQANKVAEIPKIAPPPHIPNKMGHSDNTMMPKAEAKISSTFEEKRRTVSLAVEDPRTESDNHSIATSRLTLDETSTSASKSSIYSIESYDLNPTTYETHDGRSSNSSFSGTLVRKKSKKQRKPRPDAIRQTLDFDDERALDSGIVDVRHRATRLILSATEDSDSKPDDEMLFALSKNEDITYRRSVSDMRWETEESLLDDDDFEYETDGSSDDAGIILWERLEKIGPPAAVPTIAVNERKISLSHLEPLAGLDKQSAAATETDIPTSYQSIFNVEDDNDSSDSDPVQTIFDLIDEAKSQKKGSADDKDSEGKKNANRSKLWRRRLVVVVLLNFLMRYRNPFATFNEVVVPIGVSFALIYGMCINSDLNTQSLEAKHVDKSRTEIDPFKSFSTESIFTSFCSNSEYCRQGTHRHYYIIYSPSNNFTDDLMRRVKDILKLEIIAEGKVLFPHSDRDESVQSVLKGVSNASEVEKLCQNRWKLSENIDEENKVARHYLRYPMGVIFSFNNGLISGSQMKKIEADEDLPKDLDYTIRSHYAEVANTIEGFPFTEQKTTQGKGDSQVSAYLHTGIIGMQMAIDFAFAEKIVEKSVKDGDTHMQIGIHDPVYISRETFLRRFMEEPALKMFEYPTYREKELKLKGWITIMMAILLSYVMCDICVAQAIVREQQMGSIELLKIHGMTTAMRWVAYLIITAMLRLLTSLAIALMLHYSFAVHSVANHSSPLFLWLCLWMHGCTITCFNYFIVTGIKKQEGLDWYDFPVILDTEGHSMIALPFSCNLFLYTTMMYMSLTVYMDHVIPRDYSPRESWVYCLEFLWRDPPSETSSTRPIPRSEKPTVYEPGPRDTNYGPRFRNVTLTEHKNKVTVLDNVSLDVYEGEVTCVVGQTGSGKSDFLNVIAGVKVPSSGFVDVKGMKVHEYHDLTNRHVSLCPQKQLLIESLSVEDHLRMCCMIHGASYHKAKTQATFLLQMFGLTSMRRHNHKGLTISDTKKLLVAMALSKSPSILLLDNPVDQLDPESSFQFWKLLQELKSERSIIVTCTKLEEAELYGDRIAVLSKGKLVCYGTPSHIKLAYGIGGIISMKKTEGENPNVHEITEMMEKELKGAKPMLLETKGESLQSDTLHFILPHGKYFAGLIEKLEDNMEQLRISKVMTAQPSLWALFYQMSRHYGIEQVLAKREASQILKGTNNASPGFEELSRNSNLIALKKLVTYFTFSFASNTKVLLILPVSQLKMPPIRDPNRSAINVAAILVMKKIWYYRQKHNFMLVAYIPQLILIAELVYFAYLFVETEPELLAKTISTRMYANNYILVRSADNEGTRAGWEEAFRHVIDMDDKNVAVEILGFKDDIEARLSGGLAHTLTHFKQKTIVAFSRDKDAHLGYYSSNSIHSAAIASHIIMQAFLYIISPNRTHTHSTTMVSHPYIQFVGFPPGSTQGNAGTIVGVFLSLILALLSAPAIRMVLMEKNTRFKMIQRMSGVASWLYWTCHGIGDFILYVFVVQICFAIVYFFDYVADSQFNFQEKAVLWVIFMVWLCWAGIPYTYLVSQIINAPEAGYGYYILFHFCLGIIPKIVTFQFLRLHITNVGLTIRNVLYFFPPYTITSACVHFFHAVGEGQWCRESESSWKLACDKYDDITKSLKVNDTMGTANAEELKYVEENVAFSDTFRTCCTKYCELAGTCHNKTPIELDNILFDSEDDGVSPLPGLHHEFWSLILNGFACWVLVILLEKHIIQNLFSFFSHKLCGNLEKTVASRDIKTSDEPEDVKNEHQKVDYMVEVEGDVDSEIFLVQDVTKFYKYTKGLDHVFFSVPIHAITGLLGLPKSGKTTILEVLTSQCSPSAGYVYMDNDLLDSSSRKHLMYRVGYCPQGSYLLQYLTGAQMMTIMGRLRGLKDVAKYKCETYRKGQRRRLSCAMALIGDCDLTIFDEPTVFMDSLEQYLFWNVVKRLPANNRTILFSSIDAEEIQRQSSKVLVIDSGVLVAVGQLTDIFKNNKQGMYLLIRYGFQSYKKYTNFQKKAKLDKLRDHIIQYLSPCALTDEQENLLIYHLKDVNMKLSRVYAVMEGAKVRFSSLLEHFQVSEPSLDDIVLQFHKSRNKKREKSINPILFTDDKLNTSDSQKIPTLASTVGQ
ncbi:unnamed protein product [Orchesella dallaii]|uniref:ABC transporter domain-containing protein n=1 Tax=Orchesella dallaii TaxID=48710 RepID=A0ABP1S5X8_9HEXA